MFSICQRLNSFFDFSEEVFECWRREDLLELFICLSIPRIAFWAYRGDFLTSSAFTITLLITGLQPSFGIIYACILSLSSHSLPNTNEKKKPVRSSAGIKEDDSVPLPYLQIKAELDVEHQKYELEARQKSLHELDGQDARQELSAPAHQTMGNAPMIPELN
ncbi:MAG: hypothetical protein L6R41_004407 [Letrouitia leprolyta]|nr:MAG: hypothetical protein L6R41_004407 [Letrouitia leprolyta]